MALNARATITKIEAEESGSNLKVNVTYSAENVDALWCTLIKVRRYDTGEVFCKRHSMISRDDDHIVEPLICGLLPTEPISIQAVIMGHDDYLPDLPPACPV